MDECNDIYESIDHLYVSVQEFHRQETFPDIPDPQHPRLVPTLKEYQRKAVQWMLSRELNKSSIENPLASVEEGVPETIELPSGGILADEMGLGKTVEALACILMNPRQFSKEELEFKEDIDERVCQDADKSETSLENNVTELTPKSNNSESKSRRQRRKAVGSNNVVNTSNHNGSESPCNEAMDTSDIKKEPDDSSLQKDPLITNEIKCELPPEDALINAHCERVTDNPTIKEETDNLFRQKDPLETDDIKLPGEDSITNAQSERVSKITTIKEEPDDLFRQKDPLETDGSKCDLPPEDSAINPQSERSMVSTPLVKSEPDVDSSTKKDSLESRERNQESSPEDILIKPQSRRKDPFERDVSNHVTDEPMDVDKSEVNTPTSTGKRKGRKRVSKAVESGTPLAASPTKKRKEAKPLTPVRQALKEWYDAQLAEVAVKDRTPVQDSGPSLHCFCDSDRVSDQIQCVGCKFYQHRKCVNFNCKTMKKNDYFCPSCRIKRKPIPVKTTFIVSPASISDQWIEEIQKHTKPCLKVLKYDGLWATGYLQPSTIAEHDILLTTYETLSRELNYVPDETEGTSRSLRHKKRYFTPQSPLPCLQWWRICLDEAQMVEGIQTKPSTMTRKLTAIHKWAVTGTPIQKTVDDLMGLMEFLDLTLFSSWKNWALLRSKGDEFFYFLSRIMWRHSKHEVIDQFGVPPQTVKCQWLKFSAIEGHFYLRQHNECSSQFLTKVAKYSSLDIPLMSIDRREVSRILMPLLALRQACSHPQAVRGKLLSQGRTMTMTEVLDVMVKKTQTESEEFLRQYIAALNGIAGLYIILDQTSEAIECYREVLQLCQHYEGSLTADTLQKIHTLHNLAEVLEFKPENIAPTLRDTTAKEDATKLEKEYLDKKKVLMTNTRQQLAVFAADIGDLCNGATLGYSEWWVKVIDRAPSAKELLTQLKAVLPENGLNQSTTFSCILPKITSRDRLKTTLAVWLADLDSLRMSIISRLNHLEVTDVQDLVHKALCCHLRQSRKSSKSCPLCVAEEELKNYEELLFMISKASNAKVPSENEEENDEEDGMKEDEAEASSSKVSSSVQALKNMKVFEASWKGSWKNSQYLLLLIELSNYARLKGAPASIQEDAKQHIKLMQVAKREFKTLRLLWTQTSELVQSCDELVMAKMRLRLRLPTDTPKKKVKCKLDAIHIIDAYEINMELFRLENEKKAAAGNLKKKSGTLLYLKNLQKEKTEEKVNICPICRNEMKDKWAVLVCGHCLCFECIPTMLSLSASTENVECAVCREKNPVADISYVDCHETAVDGSIKGSYSTKIGGIIRLVQQLKSEDESIKILVFSSWEKVLDILEEGFQKNNINSTRLKSGKKYKNSVKNFKSKKDVNVLLLQFKSGAKGLNLIEATHIVLAEPVLNPSDELQAVGRVHRMGQTKPTFVHRLVVENTIEEKMLSAIKDTDVNQWRKNQVTLQQLSQLFSYNPSSSIQESIQESSNQIELVPSS